MATLMSPATPSIDIRSSGTATPPPMPPVAGLGGPGDQDMKQRYCLKWNNYQSSVTTTFKGKILLCNVLYSNDIIFSKFSCLVTFFLSCLFVYTFRAFGCWRFCGHYSKCRRRCTSGPQSGAFGLFAIFSWYPQGEHTYILYIVSEGSKVQ